MIHINNFAENRTLNTVIDGIAKQGGTGVNAPIDSPAKLALKLGRHRKRIQKFRVSGEDVNYTISNSYSLPLEAFGNVNTGSNTNIKSFIDSSGLVTSIGGFAFYGTSIITATLNSATTIGPRVFDNCSQLKTANLNSVVTINGQRTFANATRVDVINMSNLEFLLGDRNFQSVGTNASSTLTVLDLRKLKSIVYTPSGSTAPNFFGIKNGITIRVHIDLATIDAGNAHPDLIAAQAGSGCVIEFYDSSGNYVSTL